MICIPYVSVPMKDGVFADDGEIHGATLAGVDNSHDDKYSVHNHTDSENSLAEEGDYVDNYAGYTEHGEHKNLIKMITQELGVRFRKQTDNSEKEADIAERGKIFCAVYILCGEVCGVVGGVYISSLLLIGCSGGCYRSTAVGAEVFSVRNVGATFGTKCH